MSANSRQVDGTHYKEGQKDAQHWDMAIDAQLNYLQGCATKYLGRWRDKNGLIDLEKAEHYCEKLMEDQQTKCDAVNHWIVTNSIDKKEAAAIHAITGTSFAHNSALLGAIMDIRQLIAIERGRVAYLHESNGAGPGYVNQDGPEAA